MPALVMECIKRVKHPNADTLYVYEFSNGEFSLPIVANQENVYEVGENAIIIREYSTMKDEDGTKIRVSKLRGIRSYGMALGHTDLPVGTDVSDEHCEPQTIVNGFTLKPWPSIELLANVRKDMKTNNELREITYRAKIKLHGTNAAIRIAADGRIAAQSRETLLTLGDDNKGFANWVDQTFKSKINRTLTEDIIIYGEWCGTGIGGCAIRSIDKKVFAVFAVQIERPAGDVIVYEPDLIADYIEPQEDVYILPWMWVRTVLSFGDKATLNTQVDVINEFVLDIDKLDPWVQETFSIEGRGEGLVMYPILDDTGMINRDDYSELAFKAKVEEHRVVKSKKAVEVDPAVAASVAEFVDLFATEARFNQIATPIGDFNKRFTGDFVKGFTLDVKKESAAELEASGLDWKQVGKDVSRAAAQWWTTKCSEQ